MVSSIMARARVRRPDSSRLRRIRLCALAIGLLGVTCVAGAQAATPLPGIERTAGSWQVMFMGFVEAQVDGQGGVRGSTQAGSINWGMLTATRTVRSWRPAARRR